MFTTTTQAQIPTKCCPGSCTQTFEVEGREVVNSFKCSSRKFTAADMYSVQRSRKDLFRRYGS